MNILLYFYLWDSLFLLLTFTEYKILNIRLEEVQLIILCVFSLCFKKELSPF